MDSRPLQNHAVPAGDENWTTERSAAFLSCSCGFIDRLRRAGLLRAIPLPGRTVRYRAVDVIALARGVVNKQSAGGAGLDLSTRGN